MNHNFMDEWNEQYDLAQFLKPYPPFPQTAVPRKWLDNFASSDPNRIRAAVEQLIQDLQDKRVGRSVPELANYQLARVTKLAAIADRTFKVSWLPWRGLRQKGAGESRGGGDTKPIRLGEPLNPAGFTWEVVEPRNRLSSSFKLNGSTWSLLVNDTGIELFASLLVPEPSLPHYIDSGDIEAVAGFLSSDTRYDGQVWIGFNSRGAGRSVNSKHFQVIPELDGVQCPLWEAVRTSLDRRTANDQNPTLLKNFPDAKTSMVAWIYNASDNDETAHLAFEKIDFLQLRNIPFNVYVRLDQGRLKVVVVPRRREKSSVFDNAWAICEIAGAIIVEVFEDYENATAEAVTKAYKETTFALRDDNKDLNPDRKPTVLITGGAGFVGANYTKYLLKSHPAYQIIVLDRVDETVLRAFLGQHVPERVDYLRGDILELKKVVADEIQRVDRVVHLAAITSVDEANFDPAKTWDTNVRGTDLLLDAFQNENERRLSSQPLKPPLELLYLSTEQVYGQKGRGDTSRSAEGENANPQNRYALSAFAADCLVRIRCPSNVFVLRASALYGPGQSTKRMLAKFIKNAIMGEPLPVYGQGEESRDKLFIDDAVRAMDWVLHKANPGSIFNVSAENELSNLSTALMVRMHLRRPVADIHHKEPPPGEPHGYSYRVDATRIRKELGWQPRVTFEVGLTRTIEWISATEVAQ